MDPDDFKRSWQSQSGLAVDADLLLDELRRDDRDFTATIFWRDVREVGIGLLMVPLWFYLGAKLALPWTWYLMVPALLWIVGYMLVDRMRHKRQPPDPGESLRRRVESSLAQVEHQIRLLRNVFWWYLLPVALAALAFVGQVTWQQRTGGWVTVLALAVMVIVQATVFTGIYYLNQCAVRAHLEPRRQELETLLMSLEDEPPAAS